MLYSCAGMSGHKDVFSFKRHCHSRNCIVKIGDDVILVEVDAAAAGTLD